mgnify:CR=1 FL=1
MRKTKIIGTIGPASESEEMIRKLCLAGMNVARLNFSHGTHDQHREKIANIKKVREELDLPIAIMLDTKGPEYRIGSFKDGKVTLKEGDNFAFTSEEITGDEHRVSVNYSDLPKELEVGDTILLNNGLMKFEVTAVDGNDIVTKVVIGGETSNKKSMSFPGKVLKQVYLSEQDKSDLLFGIEQGVDFVACSFVSVKQDIVDIREFLDANGGNSIELVAKIENQSGCDNIEEICQVCDGVMVARGDMGVEISLEKLPAIQKELITKCRLLGKRVITATEMLESMIVNSRPTRAEASDVANAVYDGTSAVMLSGETAAGAYPEEAVKMMSSICEATEKEINYKRRFHDYTFLIQNFGTVPAEAADNVIFSDTFTPALRGITAEFNGTAWTSGADYAYDPDNGVFTSLDGVITVLSGMSTLDQMQDNAAYMENFQRLSDAERATVEEARKVLASIPIIPCSACDYCSAVCKQNIGISGSFTAYNVLTLYKDKNFAANQYNWLVKLHDKNNAGDCIKCGACEKVCPQHIPIRANLVKVAKAFGK